MADESFTPFENYVLVISERHEPSVNDFLQFVSRRNPCELL
jgi:hypothetical protein